MTDRSERTFRRRKGPRRPILAAVAAVAIAGAVGAEGQQGQFGDRTDVIEVQIPVHVTEGGRPLRGLTRDRFQVLEGRARLDIVDFEVIDLAEVGTEPGAAFDPRVPVAARRRFLLLFDLSFSSAGSVVKAREAARQLVTTGLHPTDLVAVATYAESRGAQLALGFTADRVQLEAALDSLGLLDPVTAKADPLKLVVEPSLEQELALGRGRTLGPGGSEEGFNVDAEMLAVLQDLGTYVDRAERTAQINQILDLSTSLDELAGYLAAASGRKHVVYFSEGFDSSVILGTENQDRVEEITRDAATGQFWRVDSDERFGNSQAQEGLFAMLEEFRRCDCAIQAVDIGGVRAGTIAGGTEENRAIGQDGLFIMANQTGGEFYRNYNDLSQAMGKMLERTGVTYLLTVSPRNLALDGAYHPIEVRLKSAPKRTRVIHRPGYYAPRGYTQLSPEERRFATVERIVEGRIGGEIKGSVLAVAFPGRPGWSQVATYVELDGFDLRRGHEGRVLPIEIFAYALDRRGSASDYFSQGVKLDLEDVGAGLDARGFKFVGRFDLAAGSYEIRVLARNAATGASGLVATSLDVPDFVAAEPSLLPPLFIEPRGLWLVGHERSASGQRIRSPLVSGDRPLVPSAKPILKGGQPVPVMLLAHHIGGGALSARGRLVSLDGRPDTAVEITVQSRGVLAGAERVAATLLPGQVRDQGDYRLEVELVESSGSVVASAIDVVVY